MLPSCDVALLGSFFAAANRSDFAFVKCPQPIEAKPRRYKACHSNTMAPCVDAQREAGMNRNKTQMISKVKGLHQETERTEKKSWCSHDLMTFPRGKGPSNCQVGVPQPPPHVALATTVSASIQWPVEGYGIRYTIGIPYPQAHWMQTMYVFHLIQPRRVRSAWFITCLIAALGAPTAQLRGPPTSAWQPELVLPSESIFGELYHKDKWWSKIPVLRSKSKPMV